MRRGEPKFVGVELYFEDLERGKNFYTRVLGLDPTEELSGHHAKFESGSGFVCLERKGAESYPSSEKAVLFFEVDSLAATVTDLGQESFVHINDGWAVLHDPEGHNVLLLQRQEPSRR